MPDKKNWFYINSDSINAFCDEDGDSAKCDFPWLGAHMKNLAKKAFEVLFGQDGNCVYWQESITIGN